MEKSVNKLENEQWVKKIAAPFKSSGRYKKGSSAGSKGTDYQLGLLVIVLLNALRRLIKWRLSSENELAGKFDDVVLEWPEGAIFIQAKHKEKKKKGITLEELMSVNSKRDEFSIPKYFLSYLVIKKNMEKVTKVVICTNLHVNQEVLQFLNSPTLCADSVLNHQVGDCSFYTFKDDILVTLEDRTLSYYRQNFQNKGVQEQEITKENLKDFLNHLQFYFEYPPKDNIGTAVDKLLSLTACSSNVTALEISSKIRQWFQQIEGEYFSETHAKATFTEIRRDKYLETLKKFNVSFKINSLSLEGSTRIFQVVHQDGYLLQLIKVCEVLQENKLKILCTDPEDEIEIFKDAVEVFEMPCYTILLIVWSIYMENYIFEISEKLRKTLDNYSYKKVIIVSQDENSLIEELKITHCCEIIKDSITFEDLSANTQDKLLKQRNILFQGHKIKLGDLFSGQISQGQKKAVNSAILEQLVRGENIKVGLEVRHIDNKVVTYYIDRMFERDSVRTKGKEIILEENIYKLEDKVVLIQDIAGAGKTTALAHLATTIKRENPHLWIVFIKLNDYTCILNDFKENNKSIITIKELMNSRKATKILNKLEDVAFLQAKKVVLLVDGVDEISPDYTGIVLNLLRTCQKENNFAKVFVTTRPHMAGQLEDIFNVKSFKLQPFTNQDQVRFLTKYWSQHLGLKEINKNRCEEYAVELTWKSYSWINLYNSSEHLSAIPLHAMMMAEIFIENSLQGDATDWEGCKEFLEGKAVTPKLPNIMNIAKIYELFINKKQTVFKVKGNPVGNTASNKALINQFNGSLVYHRKLALAEILQKSECELFSDHRLTNEDIEEIIKIGIVQQSEDKFYFCHKTFAEYFLAESILNELQDQIINPNEEFQKFFFNKILLRIDFKIVRAFLNSFLQRILNSIPSNIFQCYESLSYEIDLESNYDLIHKLTKEGCATILQFLFKCINYETVRNKEIQIDDLLEHCSEYNNTLKVLKFVLEKGGVNIINEKGKTPLSYATESGDLEIVKFLIDKGAEVADSMLYDAIYNNKLEMVIYLLDKILDTTRSPIIPYTLAFLGRIDQLRALVQDGLDVNSKVEQEESILFGAVRGGQLDSIKYLIEQGANVNSVNIEEDAVLHVASRMRSRIPTTDLLIRLGANLNLKNQWGNTVLYKDISDLNMLVFLVKSGADVNSRNNYGETALWKATRRSRIDSVKILVANGGDVNIRDNIGATVLHYAIRRDESDIVKYFIDNCTNIDVNMADQNGNTALHIAVYDTCPDAIRYLLDFGCDANKINNEGNTPLHLAALRDDLDTFQQLVKNSDVNIKDTAGHTALHLTTLQSQFRTSMDLSVLRVPQDMVQCLLNKFADINARDGKRCTPLHLAVSEGRFPVVKCLVEHGADVNMKDRNGRTALHLAVVRARYHTVKYLLGHSAEVNLADNEGRTTLHMAVLRGRLSVVKLLVRCGADINARDNKGCNTLHLVNSVIEHSDNCFENLREIAEFLIDVKLKDANFELLNCVEKKARPG